MAWGSIPTDDMLISSSKYLEVEGRFHAKVIDVRFRQSDDRMDVDFEILSGDPADQGGKLHTERFPAPTPGCKQGIIDRPMLLAVATGICTQKEIDNARAAGRPIAINWEDMINRTCCFTIETSQDGSDPDKIWCNANFRFYAPDSPKAKGIPIANIPTTGSSAPTDDEDLI